MGCIALVRCVLVLRCGLAGVVWYPVAGWSTTVHYIVPEQYNPWNNSTIKSQTPEDGCINIENILSLHPDTTQLQPNQNVTQTHIEPEQYNPWNNSTNKSQAPEDGCINIRNMLSIK